MLGGFITRGLVLVLGYAYPAFECFKTLEKNRVEIEELLFWCQYWIIVAVLTVFERIVDIFISWLPMYGEMKIAFFIYLWYPKTKGTGYVYETFLRPYVAKYEPDIDRSLQELKARAWDLAIYYWQNCTQMGQTTFFQMLKYLASQSTKMKNTNSEKIENKQCIATPTLSSSKLEPPSPRTPNKHKPPLIRRRPPIPPPPPNTVNRAVVQSPKSDAVQVHLHSQTEFIHMEDDGSPEPVSGPGSTDELDTGLDQSLQVARLRLKRSK